MDAESPIPVLWEDGVLLAVNKPSGLPTLPDGYQPGSPFLAGELKAHYGQLWVVHRLDRGTSGVVVFARTAEAHRALNAQFESHTTGKEYHALVQGIPAWEEQIVDLALRPDGDRRHRTIVDPRRGKPAVTRLRVLARLGYYALIGCYPETGRTHQIRVHLAVLGHPLVGDELYAGWHAVGSARPAGEPAVPLPAGPAPLARLGLHARMLSVTHPATGSMLAIEAPYPTDFAAALYGRD